MQLFLFIIYWLFGIAFKLQLHSQSVGLNPVLNNFPILYPIHTTADLNQLLPGWHELVNLRCMVAFLSPANIYQILFCKNLLDLEFKITKQLFKLANVVGIVSRAPGYGLFLF